MELIDFSLSIKGKPLFKNVNVEFEEKKINHILGKNGTGKSCLVKAMLGSLPYKGLIKSGTENICIIGSYTNLPSDFRANDIVTIAKKNFEVSVVNSFIDKLNICDLPINNKIKNLSDGQRQKLKLLFYLSKEPQLIVLDEFTNALDKKSCIDIYSFLNSYVDDKQTTIINITHNLTDVEYLNGNYYLLENKSIISSLTKEDVINAYIKG